MVDTKAFQKTEVFDGSDRMKYRPWAKKIVGMASVHPKGKQILRRCETSKRCITWDDVVSVQEFKDFNDDLCQVLTHLLSGEAASIFNAQEVDDGETNALEAWRIMHSTLDPQNESRNLVDL